MLKLNKLADYATVVLTALATAPTRLLNGQALSAQTQIPAPTVAKVLKAQATDSWQTFVARNGDAHEIEALKAQMA